MTNTSIKIKKRKHGTLWPCSLYSLRLSLNLFSEGFPYRPSPCAVILTMGMGEAGGIFYKPYSMRAPDIGCSNQPLTNRHVLCNRTAGWRHVAIFAAVRINTGMYRISDGQSSGFRHSESYQLCG